jgi:hypothetical protein
MARTNLTGTGILCDRGCRQLDGTQYQFYSSDGWDVYGTTGCVSQSITHLSYIFIFQVTPTSSKISPTARPSSSLQKPGKLHRTPHHQTSSQASSIPTKHSHSQFYFYTTTSISNHSAYYFDYINHLHHSTTSPALSSLFPTSNGRYRPQSTPTPRYLSLPLTTSHYLLPPFPMQYFLL